MIKVFGCVLIKLLGLLNVFYWSSLNKIKTSMIWEVDTKFKSKGKLIIPALQGKVLIGSNFTQGAFLTMGACKGAQIIIGNNVTINQGSYVISNEYIEIGSNTIIGEYVSIRDNDHTWNNPDICIRDQGYTNIKTLIGIDVWIGRGAVICKGVEIGNGAVIGANSVVTKNVEAYSVVVGCPAKKIKMREQN